jgi:uncharacterized protein (UPF0264 family)
LAVSDHRWQRGLLVSVRDPAEAETAAGAGAAIIDVKEPAHGPLGRAAAATAAAVAGAVAGRAVVTLAGGELQEGPARLARHVQDVLGRLPEGVAPPVAVKAGPAGLTLDAWRDASAELACALPAGIEPVAVAYADWRAAAAPSLDAILAEMLRGLPSPSGGIETLLVDTFDKTGPGLLGIVTADTVAGWAALARAGGLALAVAGRLEPEDVIGLVNRGVAVVGVRSAACDGGRHGRIDATRVQSLVRICPRSCGPPSPAVVPVSGPRSIHHVKSMEVRVPHGLEKTEVRRRLDVAIERARGDFADKVSQIEARWQSEDLLAVDLVVMGMQIGSELDVQPTELVVRLQVPGMAGLFAGRIRSGIEERLGGLLGATA